MNVPGLRHTEQLVLFFAIAAPQRTRTAGRELEVGQRQLHNPSGQTDDVEQTTFKKKSLHTSSLDTTFAHYCRP